MSEPFEKLDKLKALWEATQPLKPEDHDRLWKKLRLEWNYNSNHIEGNTLTYGETELLLIQGQTVGNHDIREYEEMKAHNVGVEYIRTLAKEDRLISETDIRDLNKIILKEPFWKEALTSDGQQTRVHVIPGEYKKFPNNVRTSTGEIFTFSAPAVTPNEMQSFATWLSIALQSKTLHPVELAAQLHHKFILIHPFDDGNGRVARLLVNYVLMRAGFLPLIVKAADKSNYISALRQADVGQIDALTSYLAEQLKWVMELGLKAANGEGVEESSDVEKEIALFIHQQQTDNPEVKKRSPQVLEELAQNSFIPLFSKLESKMKQLAPLFDEYILLWQPSSAKWSSLQENLLHYLRNPDLKNFLLICKFEGYKGRAKTPFVHHVNLTLQFEDYRYRVESVGVRVEKLYSQPILSDEAENITNQVLKQTFESIRQLAEKR